MTMDQHLVNKIMQEFINAQQEVQQKKREIEAMSTLLLSSVSEAEDPSSIPLPMMSPQDDPKTFLKTFEEVAQRHCWPEEIWPLKLAPLLCGEAQLAYASFNNINMLSYTKVKEAILHRFKLTSDSYRQQFHSLKMLPGESPRIVAQKLNDLANKWLRPMETKKMKLFDKVVMGQFLSILPKEMHQRVQIQQPENLESAIKFVEELSDVLFGTEEGPSYQNVSLPNDLRNSPVFSHIADNVSTSEQTAACMVNISPRLQEQAASPSHDDLLLQHTTKKKRKEHYSSTAKKRQRIYENEEPLRSYYKMEEESRNVISRMYEKVIHLSCTGPKEDYFLEELKSKISILKEKNIYEEIFIGIFGRTGTGKNSLINALLNEKDLLPTSSTAACTSCLVQVQSRKNSTLYKAEIELISKKEWEEELKVLIKHCKKDDNLDDTENGEDAESDSANAKIKAVYGEDGLKKTLSELSKETNDIFKNCKKQISADTACKLFEKINPFISSASQSFSNPLSEQGCGGLLDYRGSKNKTFRFYWPLVKVVKIYVPKTCDLPDQVVLVDLPETGDSNKQRNEMWKEYISRCISIWIVMEMNQGKSDRNASEILNTGLRGIANGGECQNITIICTETNEIGIPSNHNVHGIPIQANSCNDKTYKAEIIHQRNIEVKKNVIDKCNKQVEKLFFGYEGSGLESPEVFTVSSKEYWNIKEGNMNILTFEETEIPKLKDHLKAIYVNQTKKAVKNYVSEVTGFISFLNVPKENAEQKADENNMMYCKLSENLKTEISTLAIFFDSTYRKLEYELMKGVVNAEKDCLYILQRILKPKETNFSDYHRTIRALCRNSGVIGFIDLNYELASPIYEAVHHTLTSIFMFVQNTRRNIKGALDLLQTNFCSDMFSEIKAVQSYRLVFIKTELRSILVSLEKDILCRRKKIIHRSIADSIQYEMNPAYKDVKELKGRNCMIKIQNLLKKKVNTSKIYMFKNAVTEMLKRFSDLKVSVSNTLVEKMDASMKLALSQFPEGVHFPDSLEELENMKSLCDFLDLNVFK